MGRFGWKSSRSGHGGAAGGHGQTGDRIQSPGGTSPAETGDIAKARVASMSGNRVAPDIALDIEEPEHFDHDPFTAMMKKSPDFRRMPQPEEKDYRETASESSSRPEGEQPADTVNIRYTRFHIAGFPGEKHAVFLPDRVKLTTCDIQEICAALSMEMPSMTVCGVGSLRHPACMTTPELRSSPAFEKIMREARSNLGIEDPATYGGAYKAGAAAASSWSAACGLGDGRPGGDGQTGLFNGLLTSRFLPAFALGALGSVASATDNQCLINAADSENVGRLRDPDGLWPGDAVLGGHGEALLSRGPGGGSDGGRGKAMEEFVNCVMEKKITTAVNGIANAAFQSNVWTFTGPRISSFELFLQRCVENGSTEVLRTCAAHMQDRAYMESKISRNLMRQLFENSEEMSPEIVENFEAVTLPGDLWHPHRNGQAHNEFREHGWDYWSFDSYDQESARGHPLLQWPWPWADLFFFFYRERRADGPATSSSSAATSSSGSVDWGFMTEKRHDRDAIPFQADLLAPPGYVFMADGPLMKKKILQAMQVMRPVIVIDNTPGLSKQMSAFLAVAKSVLQCNAQACREFLKDGAKLSSNPTALELLRELSPAKVLKHMEREFGSSSLERHSELTLSDIVGILDLFKQRPHAFKETMSVVDPLSDTLEQILPKLSATFSSVFASGSVEMNAMAVNDQLVLKGWRLHRKLVQSKVKLRRYAAGMDLAIVIVMLLSTVLAVIVVYLHLERDRIEAAMLMGSASQESIDAAISECFPVAIVGILKVWMLVLPVTAGILMTLQTHFHFLQKWAHVNFASGQVVSEIYQFLGNVGRYSSCAAASINRQRFLKRLQDIRRNLAILGIRDDELMGSEESSRVDVTADSEALTQHINLTVYGISPPSWLSSRARDCYCWGWESDRLGADGRFVNLEHIQDLTAPLSADAYMELRVVPLMRHYKGLSDSASRLRAELKVVFFLCLAVSSVLAAFSFALWIPLIVVVSLSLIIFIQNFAPLESVTAVNTGLTALHNLELRWHGARISEQRSEAMKKRIIMKTERITLAVAAAISRSPMLPDDDEEGEEDDCLKDGTPSTSTLQSRQESARTTPCAGLSNQASATMSPVRPGPMRSTGSSSPHYSAPRTGAWM